MTFSLIKWNFYWPVFNSASPPSPCASVVVVTIKYGSKIFVACRHDLGESLKIFLACYQAIKMLVCFLEKFKVFKFEQKKTTKIDKGHFPPWNEIFIYSIISISPWGSEPSYMTSSFLWYLGMTGESRWKYFWVLIRLLRSLCVSSNKWRVRLGGALWTKKWLNLA
jgi:hypothetical protein